MRRREDELKRVGAGLVILVAAVGLLLLVLLHGTAYPAEPAADPASDPDAERAAELLLDQTPMTPAERLAQAQEELAKGRRARIAGTLNAVGQAATSAFLSVSPSHLWRSSRDLGKAVWRWNSPAPEEARALELLEPDVRAGLAEPAALDVYQDLRRRELEPDRRRALESTESALWELDFAGAGRGLLGLVSPDRRPEERDQLGSLLEPSHPTVQPWLADPEVVPWETSMAAAMLSGNYGRAAGLGPRDPDADLTRAAALLLAGQRGEARRSLEEIKRSDEATLAGDIAGRWLEEPAVDPEAALVRAERSWRVRRTLGWLGGDELEQHGLERSRESLEGWRGVFTPMNLLISFPSRVLRGRGARSDDLREAAERYLALEPGGSHESEALGWLELADPSAEPAERSAVWDDAAFILPRARTPYPRVAAEPLVLTRDLVERLEQKVGPELRASLADADAVLLVPAASLPSGDAELAPEPARRVVAELADAVEGGDAIAIGSSEGAALESLRRMDAELRAGRSFGLRPWQPADASLAGALLRAFSDGEESRHGESRLTRGRDDVSLDRPIVGARMVCPRATVCLDQKRAFEAVGIASIDLSGNLALGARTSVHDTSLALGLDGLRPSASLQLPLSRWLGFSEWLRLSAELGVGPDGLWVRPRISDPESESEPRRPSTLSRDPFGDPDDPLFP